MQFQKINNSQISLLICSRDNPIAMRRLVDRVKKMDCSYQFEITVIEETDIPTAIEGVRYIQLPVHNRGIAYARNQALKYSKGEITIFIDDDCDPTENWMDFLLEPFENPSVIGVQGGVSDGGNSVEDLTAARETHR